MQHVCDDEGGRGRERKAEEGNGGSHDPTDGGSGARNFRNSMGASRVIATTQVPVRRKTTGLV